MLGEVDLAEASFPNQSAERVVADGLQFGGGELGEEGLVGVRELEAGSAIASISRSGGFGVVTDLVALFLLFILLLRPGRRHPPKPSSSRGRVVAALSARLAHLKVGCAGTR